MCLERPRPTPPPPPAWRRDPEAPRIASAVMVSAKLPPTHHVMDRCSSNLSSYSLSRGLRRYGRDQPTRSVCASRASEVFITNRLSARSASLSTTGSYRMRGLPRGLTPPSWTGSVEMLQLYPLIRCFPLGCALRCVGLQPELRLCNRVSAVGLAHVRAHTHNLRPWWGPHTRSHMRARHPVVMAPRETRGGGVASENNHRLERPIL